MKRILLFNALLLLLVLVSVKTFAQSDFIEKHWYNAEKSAKILIYKAKDGKFYGKITWLKEPNKNGKPKVDENNPDKEKQTQPVMGLLLLKGLEKDGINNYSNGTIYDPKNGKTYSCKIKRNHNNLDLRGYIGISLIGRTSTWTPAD